MNRIYEMLMNDSSIEGLKMRNMSLKCMQYANDLTVFLTGYENDLLKSINSSMEVLQIFCRKSGLTINLGKTEILSNCEEFLRPHFGNFVFVTSTSLLGIEVTLSSHESRSNNENKIMNMLLISIMIYRITPLPRYEAMLA
uniref:Reverse transcriptase domain-containing protein n=1 Tax=Lepeophtheirus salmonis TaxID=72036 RepID=A0A0K2UZA2_LEPSM